MFGLLLFAKLKNKLRNACLKRIAQCYLIYTYLYKNIKILIKQKHIPIITIISRQNECGVWRRWRRWRTHISLSFDLDTHIRYEKTLLLLHECNSNFKLFDHKPSASKLSTESFHILYFPIHVVRNSDQVP